MFGLLRNIFLAMTDVFKPAHLRGIDAGQAPIGWKVAICVGHSRSGDLGAISVGGVDEWHYNRTVANRLKAKLADRDIEAVVIDNYQGGSYGSAMRWLGREIKRQGCHAAIELHFNAATPSAQGFEYLYFQTSAMGKKLAKAFLKAHEDEFPEAKSRGVKGKGPGDRGANFLRETHCPSIICEPFFGSNKYEWAIYAASKEELAECYCQAIVNYLS